DSFTFGASDGSLGSNVATVSITVRAVAPAQLVFAHGTSCDALHVSGADTSFHGAVTSNGGVDVAGSTQVDRLACGSGGHPPERVKPHGAPAAQVEAAAPRDWPVAPPVCTPACSTATADAHRLVTSVGGVPCIAAPAAKWTVTGPLAPGL